MSLVIFFIKWQGTNEIFFRHLAGKRLLFLANTFVKKQSPRERGSIIVWSGFTFEWDRPLEEHYFRYFCTFFFRSLNANSVLFVAVTQVSILSILAVETRLVR